MKKKAEFIRFIIIVVLSLILIAVGYVSLSRPEDIEDCPPIVDQGKCADIVEEKEEIPLLYSVDDITLLAKTLYGECRGIPSDMEKAAVAWVILNRVDYYGSTVSAIVTAPYQFAGYNPNHPVLPELYALAEDVLSRWNRERAGETDVGRIIPSDYLYFNGYGGRNHFRNKYRGGTRWNWSLPNPYES